MDAVDSDDDDITSFFSKRAKFVPKYSYEEFQTAAKFQEEIQEERKKKTEQLNLTKDTKSLPTKKARGHKKATQKVIPEEPVVITVKENQIQEDNLDSPLPLSATAKRRLNKIQRDIKRVEEENKKVLSLLNKPSNHENKTEVIVDDLDIEKCLTILHFYEIHRVKYDVNETFSTILPRIGDLFKLSVPEFLLCFRDKTIKVDDSPKSLNIADCDILEFIPYKAQENEASKFDENRLMVVFQASDTKEKMELYIHKLEKMQNVMEKYSKARNIPLNGMVFEFDGEQVSGTETPQDLDMESGNCIDVRILNAEDKQSRKESKMKNASSLVDLTAEDSNSNSSDIIFCE